jgi:hypothetical protein
VLPSAFVVVVSVAAARSKSLVESIAESARGSADDDSMALAADADSASVAVVSDALPQAPSHRPANMSPTAGTRTVATGADGDPSDVREILTMGA